MSSRQIGSKTGRFGAIPKIRTVSDDVSHHKKTWHIKIPTDSDDLGLGHLVVSGWIFSRPLPRVSLVYFPGGTIDWSLFVISIRNIVLKTLKSNPNDSELSNSTIPSSIKRCRLRYRVRRFKPSETPPDYKLTAILWNVTHLRLTACKFIPSLLGFQREWDHYKMLMSVRQ